MVSINRNRVYTMFGHLEYYTFVNTVIESYILISQLVL